MEPWGCDRAGSPADPYRALGPHGAGVVSTASRKTLAAGHLGRRAGAEQFRLVELNQQGVDRQALHALVGALHSLLIPLRARLMMRTCQQKLPDPLAQLENLLQVGSTAHWPAQGHSSEAHEGYPRPRSHGNSRAGW